MTTKNPDHPTTKQIIAAIRSAGVRGAHFQVRDLYERLGIKGNRKACTAVTARIPHLRKIGAVEALPGRKRNCYYVVKDAAALRAAARNGRAHRGLAITSPPAEAFLSRLSRIEEGLTRIEETCEQLLEIWS